MERVLYNLFIRGLKLPQLREKASEYVKAGLLPQDRTDNLLRALEQEKQDERVPNALSSEDLQREGLDPGSLEGAARRLSQQDLEVELARREACLQTGREEAVTDQSDCGSVMLI